MPKLPARLCSCATSLAIMELIQCRAISFFLPRSRLLFPYIASPQEEDIEEFKDKPQNTSPSTSQKKSTRTKSTNSPYRRKNRPTLKPMTGKNSSRESWAQGPITRPQDTRNIPLPVILCLQKYNCNIQYPSATTEPFQG